MTSPGGLEVGRVSVAVVPDVSKFRKELAAKLRKLDDVEVNVQASAAGLREQIQATAKAASAGVDAQIGIDIEKSSVAQLGDSVRNAIGRAVGSLGHLDIGQGNILSNSLERVQDNAARIRASLERVAIAFREVTNSSGNLRGHFQGIQQAARQVGSELRRIRMPSLFERDLISGQSRFERFSMAVYTGAAGVGNAIRTGVAATFQGAVKGIDAFGEAAGGALDSALGGANRLGVGMNTVFTAVTGALQALVVMGAVSTVLVLAGAAISAAWGIVASAVASLPAAVALIGVPIAAVALGLDGIKKAAKSLEPEFDRLKASVSAAFERGLLPVFGQLRQVFPDLRSGLTGTAESLSGIAAQVARLVTSGPGLQMLRDTFYNANQALNNMGPGLTAFISGILRVTSQSSGLQALAGAFTTLGIEFDKSVARMTAGADGMSIFDRAMQGLRGTLEAVGRLLIGIVEGGLKLFVGAAPGVNGFLDSITWFLSRFDWERLGTSVGAVFEGLGKALDKVPQSTITGIEQAFDRIGALFQSPQFQAAFTQLLSALPDIVTFIGNLTKGFISLSTVAVGVAQILGGVGTVIQGLFTLDPAKIAEGTAQALKGFETLKTGVQLWLADINTTVAGGMTTINGTIVAGAAQWGVSSAAAGTATGDGLRTAVVTTQGAASALAAATAPPPGTNLSAPWAAGVQPIPGVVGQGLQPIPTQVETAVNGLAPIITGAFQGLESHVSVGVGKLATAVQDGGKVGFAAAMTTALGSLGPAIDAGFAGLSGRVVAGIGQVASVITGGFAGIVGPAFRAGWDSVASAANTSFQNLSNAVLVHMGSIAGVVTAGFPQVRAAFDRGMADCRLAVDAGIAGMLASLSGAVPAFAGYGVNMGSALASGLRSREGEVRAAATALANAAAAATRAAAGIRSPSRLFMGLGSFMTQGLAIGLARGFPAVERLLEGKIGRLAFGASSGIVDGFADSFAGGVDPLMPDNLGYVDSDIVARVQSDDFGGFGSEIRDAAREGVSEGIAGWKMDGYAVMKAVNNRNLRRRARG